MSDVTLTYDILKDVYIHEPTQWMMTGEFLMVNETDFIVRLFKEDTGLDLDPLIVDSCRGWSWSDYPYTPEG